jgi:hypothetical protein
MINTTTTTIPAVPDIFVAQFIGDAFKFSPIIAWIVITEEFKDATKEGRIACRDIQARSFPVTQAGWFDGLYDDSPWYIVDTDGDYHLSNGAHIGDSGEAEAHARNWARGIEKNEREARAKVGGDVSRLNDADDNAAGRARRAEEDRRQKLLRRYDADTAA